MSFRFPSCHWRGWSRGGLWNAKSDGMLRRRAISDLYLDRPALPQSLGALRTTAADTFPLQLCRTISQKKETVRIFSESGNSFRCGVAPVVSLWITQSCIDRLSFLTPRISHHSSLPLCFFLPQPSQKTFRTKRTLAKKQRQNRPLPHWIRLRTDNSIKWNAKRRHWRRTKLGL